MRAYAPARGDQWKTSGFISAAAHFFETGSLTGLELVDLTRLGSQQVPVCTYLYPLMLGFCSRGLNQSLRAGRVSFTD